ncbi:MAG: GNAT family N-acetyltransferase [Actinomycetes bacterium]
MTGPYAGEQPVLRDATVVLRPLRGTDLPDVLEASRDPETRRWTTIPSPYGEEHARSFIADYAPGFWAEHRGAVWAMCPAGSDRFGGAFDLRVLADDPARADVGFACAPWARGRGVTTAALRLACRWGFETLSLTRIEWRAYVGNDGSRRVAEKAGFVIEGIQRARLVQRGERRDCWVGSLLPGDLR